MPAGTQRWIYELVKAAVLIGLFVLIQQQIAGVRLEVSGEVSPVAQALGRYQNDFFSAREDVLRALEDAREEVLSVQGDLEDSARTLVARRDEVLSMISDRDDQLVESFSLRLANYQGSLDSAIGLSATNLQRIRDVERQVRRLEPYDPSRMEKAMICPIIQLKGNKTVGSGVIIYSGTDRSVGKDGTTDDEPPVTFAVTAYHVAKEILGDDFPIGTLTDVKVIQGNGETEMRRVSATVEVFDAEQDLALLRLRTGERFENVAQLVPKGRISDLDLFTRIYAVGCPLGNRPLPTYGQISSKHKQVGDQVFWMVTAPTFFGNSGGGIFLAETGELVGISSMIYTYTYGLNRSMVVPHMGLFVPIDTVVEWLESTENYGFLAAGQRERKSTAGPPRPEGIRGASHDEIAHGRR